jgi:peptide-methionine (S)-S-oxide reductase
MKILIIFAAIVFLFEGCSLNSRSRVTTKIINNIGEQMKDTSKLETATFGGGCFWCIEAIFQDLKGVEKVESGYSGGTTKYPTYQEVCSGTTGHAEVVQITFNPAIISYDQILEVFWHVHDPTTLNRQGADVGTQYRSVIFYHNDEQKISAENSKKKTEDSKLWDEPIITEISPFMEFYKAEDYHQNYYKDNPEKSYCSLVIAPKVRKFYKEYDYLLKDEAK